MQYGLYPQKTGVFDNAPMMADNGRSYPAVLGSHGYRTHAVGKCHFGPDARALRGFQSRQIQEECTSEAKSDDYIAWLRDNGYDYYEPHGARGEMYYIPQISSLSAEAHPSRWVAEESVQFVNDASRGEQPWCLFSSFIHPHPPFTPPKPWHKLYRAPDMPLPFVPEESDHLYTWINRLQNRYKFRDRGVDLNLLRVMKAYYYATISFVDYQIGRIIEALKTCGQLDNTLILFASDHGEYLGDFNCFGKRNMHDVSARVPMVVRFPRRFPQGHKCTTAVSLVDVFPTLTGAAGIAVDSVELDGIDLSNVVTESPKDRIVYSQYGENERAIYMAVNRNWKYYYSAGDNQEFFFDQRQVPRESKNLTDDDDDVEVQKNKNVMKKNLLDYLEATGRTEAYTTGKRGLDWRQYPRFNEDYLNDPDAELLFQDYPSYKVNLPGYAEF
jgi:arylsulfatase